LLPFDDKPEIGTTLDRMEGTIRRRYDRRTRPGR